MWYLSQCEDADAGRVHPAQWLFPPNTTILADVRHRLETSQPHLPDLHHVNEISHFSQTFSTLVEIVYSDLSANVTLI